jgi:hypothetical protein
MASCKLLLGGGSGDVVRSRVGASVALAAVAAGLPLLGGCGADVDDQRAGWRPGGLAEAFEPIGRWWPHTSCRGLRTGGGGRGQRGRRCHDERGDHEPTAKRPT